VQIRRTLNTLHDAPELIEIHRETVPARPGSVCRVAVAPDFSFRVRDLERPPDPSTSAGLDEIRQCGRRR